MKIGILARTAVCVLSAAALSLATAGTSQAANAELSLTYSCTFMLIGAQDMPSKVTAEGLPDAAVVGQPTAPAATKVVTTVSQQASDVLNWLGAATVEGSLTTKIPVDNAGTVQNLTSTLTIPSTPVGTGVFDVTATGTLAPMTFTTAGTTKIGLGDADLTLTPRLSDGSETFLGTFNVPCTVKPGQNTQLHQFEVTAAS